MRVGGRLELLLVCAGCAIVVVIVVVVVVVVVENSRRGLVSFVVMGVAGQRREYCLR